MFAETDLSADVRTIRLLLAYDGSGFHGWQVQPAQPTVQQALSDALRTITGETIVVHGSGRTDAGVHALGQVAHLKLHSHLPLSNLRRALNARLPASIRVLEVAEAAALFHARHDAHSKLYRYRIYREEVCPPFLAHYVYHHPYPLNEAVMILAAPAWQGRHDFRSFAATPEKGSSVPATTVRTVFRSELARLGAELIYEIEGQGFLHHMVRNIVGFLLEIGRGARTGREVEAVLAARARSAAGPTAPARGLYLVRVGYGENR
ncbi:MAG: tRNA pseudouridine(38-40) synthase TruA [Terriglobales bacterium]